MLKIYNTLSRSIEEFKPVNPGLVNIYVCGPTVYGFLHVGNFRGPVFFNLVRNWLEQSGYKVNYSMNFTDVEDKIIKRANDENVSATDIAERYIVEYKKDYSSLDLRPHTSNPKVSDYMPQIISMISDLIQKNKAYESQGDVNYSVRKFSDYGKLSGRKIDDLRDSVRIDPSEKKEDALDFALWKTAKPAENLRGSVWDSPWGAGRPGWHIECSAMIQALFKGQIDIHGGGLDLMFPHHENEIAQTNGCKDHGFVKYWMHWNLFNFGGSKMSKSLGNVINMREFLEKQHPEIYKWIVLSVHYRSVADFSDLAVEIAVGGLAKVYSALALADSLLQTEIKIDDKYQNELNQAWVEITEALNHDFGTPNAFAVIFEQIRKFNTFARRGLKTNPTVAGKSLMFKEFILKFGNLISLFQEPAETFLTQMDDKLLNQKNILRSAVDQIVSDRSVARLAKDFAKSDEYRKQLTDLGIAVSDLSEGSFWEVIK